MRGPSPLIAARPRQASANLEQVRGFAEATPSGTLGAGGKTKSYLACYIRLEKSDGWCRHMANLQGYGTAAVGNMLNHYTRHGHDRDQTRYTYANQSIDPARTHMNYAIFERVDPAAFVQAFVKAADVPPRGGKKATNVISDWVITLPKNETKNGREGLEGREREFFKVAYDFLRRTVPEDLVVGAWVHMDENQPHMHFCFVPLVETPVMTNDKSRPLKNKDGSLKRDKKGTVRYARVPKVGEDGKPVVRTSFGQTKVYDREAMRRFHPALEKAMEEHFGFRVGIMLDEKQAAEKALSNVAQKDIDKARAAIAAPAEAAAARARAKEARAQMGAAAARAEVAESRAVLGGLQAEVEEKQALAAELSAEIKEKVAAREEIAAEISGLAGRIADAREELEQAREERDRARDEAARARDECEGLRRRLDGLRTAYEGLRRRVEDFVQAVGAHVTALGMAKEHTAFFSDAMAAFIRNPLVREAYELAKEWIDGGGCVELIDDAWERADGVVLMDEAGVLGDEVRAMEDDWGMEL